MKIYKLLSLLLIASMTLSLVGIVSTSAKTFDFSGLNGENGLNYDNSPTLIEAVSDDLVFESSSLPNINAFWTDLVDTEQVSNDGSGVYVAVLDTGLLSSWEFFFSQANIRDDLGVGFSHDITWDNDINNIVIGPLDSDRGFITDLASGHGTHVTSTIAGFNYNNIAWVPGVAPNVQIIPVLTLDAWLVDTPFGPITLSGGTDVMIAAGINYIANLASSLDGPVVINMSLGGSSPSAMIRAAIQNAIAEGVIVVASAGNSGSAGMGYPGGFPEVISAAAAGWTTMFSSWWDNGAPEMDELRQGDSLGNSHQLYLEDFSSRPNMDLGQKHQDLDVAAPGAWVVGPFKSAFANNVGYYFLSGTSMASPHVAAIAALVLQSHPDLTQSKMEFILKLAASGNPLPASDALVYFPFQAPGYYTATWDGGDYGSGFLTAPDAIDTAAVIA